MTAPFSIKEVSFSDLPGWRQDDPGKLFPAMATILSHLRNAKPYRTGALGVTAAELVSLLDSAEKNPVNSPEQARRFFETNCVPFRISSAPGKSGFVTAFYEPELEVSSEPDDIWRYPIYRRPAELVDIDDTNRPAGFDTSYAFGRADEDGISYFPDRRAIDEGYLEGRGLEIAWARSKVDLFFVHVQGAARLVFRDGAVKRITYAAKAGHAFSPIGRLLLDRGELDPKTVSMQTIRKWLADHPDKVDGVLWHNRSYIFSGRRMSPISIWGRSRLRRFRWSRGEPLRWTGSSTLSGFPSSSMRRRSPISMTENLLRGSCWRSIPARPSLARRVAIFSPAPVSKRESWPVRCAMRRIFIY